MQSDPLNVQNLRLNQGEESENQLAEPAPKRPKIDCALEDSIGVEPETTEISIEHILSPASPRLSTTAEVPIDIISQPLAYCTLPSPQVLVPIQQALDKVQKVVESSTAADFPTSSIHETTLAIQSNVEPIFTDQITPIQEQVHDMKRINKFRIMYISVLIFGLFGQILSRAGSVPVMRNITPASNATNTTNATTSISTDPNTSSDSIESSHREAFMSALLENNITVVSELLKKDPSLANIPDANGWLPIHEAASEGHLELVQTLLEHSKENINARTSTGGSVLYWALEGQADHDYEHPVIQELLKNGAINYPADRPISNDSNVTLDILSSFNRAAADNDVEKLSSILSEYPDVINHADINGYQAIHEAAQYGHIEALEFLLDHGASIDTRTGADFDGPTALYLALDNGLESDHPVVLALWNAGAVPLAEGFLFTDMSPEITGVGFAPEDMVEAIRSGDCDLLAEFADERPNWLRIMDENGWLPIHEAAILGHMNCVDVILNALGDIDFINVRVFGSGGNALYWAKQELGEDSPMVQHLVSLGAEELEPMPDEL